MKRPEGNYLYSIGVGAGFSLLASLLSYFLFFNYGNSALIFFLIGLILIVFYVFGKREHKRKMKEYLKEK